MEKNTEHTIESSQKNGSNLPQLVEVRVPVGTGMSNSIFVVWFVAIFIVAFIILSYFGLVPEGVREINTVLFSSSSLKTENVEMTTFAEAGMQGVLGTTSQEVGSTVVSVEQVPASVLQIKPLSASKTSESQVALGGVFSNEGKVLPVRLVIEKVGVNTVISNPTSQKISVLDQALLSGGVRYPGSASLEEPGNMLLFGHSSGLTVTRNKAYQAFNGINKLAIGDQIKVYSDKSEYLYKVTKVLVVSADKQLVEFPSTGKTLTLSTCNSFGLKSDRFVVEAQFVGSYPIAN